MKAIFFTFTFLLSISSVAVAQSKPSYDIPISEKDFRPEAQPQFDHSEYRVKKITCDGREYGVLYKSYWGWSHGSTFEGICSWSSRLAIEKCQAEKSRELLICHNKTIQFYKLDFKYPLVDVDAEMNNPDASPPDVSHPHRRPLIVN
jgi:hypothetical protein